MKNINEEKVIKFVTIIIFIIIIFFALKNNLGSLGNLDLLPTSIVETKKEQVTKIHELISPKEYKQKLDSGEYIHIDIRTEKEYREESISKGLLIDFYSEDFIKELDKLDKEKKYIYHCRSGNRSAKAAKIFEKLGFVEVYQLEGGISNWKRFNDIKK